MKLVRLTQDTELSEFDCGDDDLNNFLIEDAKAFLNKRIANSFILEDEGRIAAYFCLLNDKISREDVTKVNGEKLRGDFQPGRNSAATHPLRSDASLCQRTTEGRRPEPN